MPTSPPTDFTPTAWSNHPGYDLTKYTLSPTGINDLDRHQPGVDVIAYVKATRFKGDQTAFVQLDIQVGPAELQTRMSAGNARTLGNALLQAADILDAYNTSTREALEADQLRQKEDTELARYNAGPLTTRLDIADGLVAFETAEAEGGAS